ncbi:AI-2E family transporter [Nocardioides anomalus]|uniref:AI-2E family transporter n=1 Tax=Nocardioides anomalus TaxID=2712223 RepID=A0A6G6WG68_9ACTN|nr:AI-2E family transporter [Nocardioides anomalus]QIG44341.1 AI-2E family transporter [Nocardioides anomalus]
MSDEAPARPAEPHGSVATRLAQQWAAIRRLERRQERAPEPVTITAGTSNFSRAEVPYGVDLTAAWSWRLLVIAGAAALLGYLIGFFAVIVIPVVVALLITALVAPLVDWLERVGVRRSLASILVVLFTITSVAALLTFAGQQVANGASDLADQTVAGLQEIRDWLKDGPLHASDSQINDYIQKAQDGITKSTGEGGVISSVTEVGAAVGHVLAGFFIVLFSTYFFLSDGSRIWAWLVRLSPRAARERVDGSGRVAWISLTQFVRATVIVAATDAILIGVGAWALSVPFSLAIGVLVFLGAFVPIVGATVAGAVAVLVALVDQGLVRALIMLAVVIGVQQLEGHVLQPFLMGRWVSVHPLGVILAIGAGVLTAGVAGALVAVPLAAAVNAVAQHLAAYTDPGDDPVEELAEDYLETGETAAVEEHPEPPGDSDDPDDGRVGG